MEEMINIGAVDYEKMVGSEILQACQAVIEAGAMGTWAKSMVNAVSIPFDFTLRIINTCFLRALVGKSSLVVTTVAMVPEVEQRNYAFREESGTPIHPLTLV